MSLPHSTGDEAEFRALDRKCADPNSIVSKRIVRQLAAESLEYKEMILNNSCIWGLGNLVRCALEAQVSPDLMVGETRGTPVLVLAATYGATPALKALLAGGANIELPDTHDVTALAAAAGWGHLTSVQLLLNAGANANARDRVGNTPLMVSVVNKHVECARALLPACDLALTNLYACTAFHASVRTGSEACFELLLPAYDVDVRTVPGVDARTGEAMDAFNETPLHFACELGHLPMCKALLGRGADRVARDSRQWTPLHCAAAKGHLSCVILLVGRPGKVRMTPAEVDAADEHGFTALHYAAAGGRDQICGVLLGAGARLDSMTPEGFTPLMYAQQFNPTNMALLDLLSDAGHTQLPNLVCDHCGKTAEDASAKSLKSCGECYAVRYCGKECQLVAWPGHKVACKAWVKNREERAQPTVFFNDSP